MKKKSLTHGLILGSSFLVVLLIATFFDLQINIALSNSSSLFGQFFNYLGETPAYLATPIASIIIYQGYKDNNKLVKWIFGLATIIGSIIFWVYLSAKFWNKELDFKMVYVILFGILSGFLLILATNKVDKALMKKLVVFAIVLFILMAVSQIIIHLLKSTWSRMRFRNMDSSYNGFTPWYLPQFGVNGRESLIVPGSEKANSSDAFKSFPSGHTAAAAVSLALMLIPDLIESQRKYKTWYFVIPIIYTILVAISRIVNRAHFLSDVLFGGAITALVYLATSKLTVKYIKKYRISHNKE